MEMNDATGNYFSGIYPEEIVVGRHASQAPMVTLRPESIVATYMANDPIGVIFFGVDTKTDETYVNLISDSIRFNGRNIANFTYSTEEQWTGDYWIDGKKIYSKVVSIPRSAFTSQQFTYNHGIINLDKCIYKYAFWDDTSYSPTRIRELPSSYYGSIEWSGQILVTPLELSFEVGSMFYERVKNSTLGTYFYVIMKYTKNEVSK